MSSSAPLWREDRPRRDWPHALMAIIGGSLVVVGSALPWMSLFAGLHAYSGLAGYYGRLILAGGALSILGGATMLARPRDWLRLGIGGVGVALAVFAAWILVGLSAKVRELGHHPMLLARPGPGVFVVIAGAIALAAVLLPVRRRI
jgi:hypothetical protein